MHKKTNNYLHFIVLVLTSPFYIEVQSVWYYIMCFKKILKENIFIFKILFLITTN